MIRVSKKDVANFETRSALFIQSDEQTGGVYLVDNLGRVLKREELQSIIDGLVQFLDDPDVDSRIEKTNRFVEDDLNRYKEAELKRRQEQHDRKGHVYIAYSPSHDSFKIGCTTRDVEERVREAINAPIDPQIVHTIKCESNCLSGEQIIHAQFAHRHEGKEWFRLTRDDLRKLKKIKEIKVDDPQENTLSVDDEDLLDRWEIHNVCRRILLTQAYMNECSPPHQPSQEDGFQRSDAHSNDPAPNNFGSVIQESLMKAVFGQTCSEHREFESA